MSWKLLLLIPVLLIVFLFSNIFYQYYRYEHKYDHLPKVQKTPGEEFSRELIKAYKGPHPSVLMRPIDPTPDLIKLGQVGPVQSLFSGPPQYPFLCNTEESNLGQPLVDNYDGIGMPVYIERESGEKTNHILGYSKDCSIPTRAIYYYQSNKDDRFYPLTASTSDINLIDVGGKNIPFIVRVESGTINRFIYTIAVLKGAKGSLSRPDSEHWNRRLIYQFRGGVGVGHKQGKGKPIRLLERRVDELKQGYAVIFSTGNQTANHFNIWLAEDTALRVKRQFNALYGKEDYTVGVGGSGGAIQQYLISQNNPSLLDAAIALYSYPDMITQTTYVFDCELLEYYFDVTDRNNKKWQTWENRRFVAGLNAKSGVRNKTSILNDLSLFLKGNLPSYNGGLTECSNGWRGITALVNNPTYIHFYQRFSPQVLSQTHWSHWEDLKFFYGVNEHGYAAQTFDNVGVQYGLSALLQKQISEEEFLNINANIGGWKSAIEMSPERFGGIGGDSLSAGISVWGEQNMSTSESSEQVVAARTEGSLEAMKAAYRSGHVFLGTTKIPVIDLRHYLDDELDMHHASASFSTRKRMLKAKGHANNQLIWMTRKPHNPLPDALDMIDKWLVEFKRISISERENDYEKMISASRPTDAFDRCYSAHGEVLAQGANVWDGMWNGKFDGDCMTAYPIYSESRSVAGADLAGDTFKCELQSVTDAIRKGLYGSINMENYQEQLETIFPEGVCDYSKPDRGFPDELFIAEPGEMMKSPHEFSTHRASK
ncbi:DUF6351 family protein [Aliikangiella coralliicola]|uniref:DUF6351 domain-containing protein n=1 Tax=Aliikangiella coralliicola TaxID=2592383 RepID=A0A545UJJ0_9GAMM|nr:DUF6351 family protein [Aliikangiella coralliicola]TQV89632.1 hypothetical protein FLL46_01755 [Aliikangiella coralliicola]